MFSRRMSVMVKYATVALLGFMITTTSCKKKKDDDGIIDKEQTSYAEDQLVFEQINSTIDRIIEAAYVGGATPFGPCAIVTKDTTDNPDMNMMRISFAGNCIGIDGRARNGAIIVHYTKALSFKEKGFYQKITFENYRVEGHRVASVKEVWNAGIGASGNLEYLIASQDTVYLANNSGKITGASERTREFFSGANTPQTSDDVYRLTGFGHFIGLDKNEYSIQIHRALVDAYNCHWLQTGVINIFPIGLTQRALNFGDGECDNDAIIDVNGVERIAKIP